ncbi:MAG: hypothetical protein R2788_25245 [Saprospiraceae bacterium]
MGIFVAGIGVMLFGIFKYGWYMNEISAVPPHCYCDWHCSPHEPNGLMKRF